jgi:hypothetical protein
MSVIMFMSPLRTGTSAWSCEHGKIKEFSAFNLGNSSGFSVMEVIERCKIETGGVLAMRFVRAGWVIKRSWFQILHWRLRYLGGSNKMEVLPRLSRVRGLSIIVIA